MLWRRSSGLIMFLVNTKIQAFLWTQAKQKFRTDYVCDLIKQQAIHTQLHLCFPKKCEVSHPRHWKIHFQQSNPSLRVINSSLDYSQIIYDAYSIQWLISFVWMKLDQWNSDKGLILRLNIDQADRNATWYSGQEKTNWWYTLKWKDILWANSFL